jgi:prepilin-type N-terminal cleavage/methylation domain-containing protein
MSRQGACEDERGFTLAEVMVTIIMMGIIFAIASSTWFGVVEGRRVDSATNQLAADLRLAHTRATNRLEQWQVVLYGDSSYAIGPTDVAEDCQDDEPNDDYLCLDLDDELGVDKVVVDTAATITFEPDGSALLEDACSETLVRVSSADGDPDHDIEINAATSRIQIDPVDPAEC